MSDELLGGDATKLIADGQSVDAKQGMFRVSLNRNFGPFFYTQLFEAFGNWVQNLAATVLIFQLTGSAILVGAVSACQFGAMFVLSPLAGAIADRYDKRRIAITATVISACSIGTLAIWSYGNLDHRATPVIVLLAIAVKGTASTFCGPATKAMIPSLVSGPNLHPAVALDQMTFTVGRAVGPMLGALMLLIGGPTLAFTFTALASTAFAIGIFLVHPLHAKERKTRERLGVWSGFHHVLTTRALRNLVIGVTFLGFAVDPTMTLTPSLADDFGHGAGMVAIFVTAFGVGSICSAAVTTPVSKRMTLRGMAVLGLSLCTIGLAIVMIGWTQSVAVSGFFIAGFGYFFGNVAIATQVQILVPDHLRGRVMAVWAMAFFGARPLASLMNGTLADIASVRLALAATLILAGCGAVILHRGTATAPSP